jgi:hypothetical protein
LKLYQSTLSGSCRGTFYFAGPKAALNFYIHNNAADATRLKGQSHEIFEFRFFKHLQSNHIQARVNCIIQGFPEEKLQKLGLTESISNLNMSAISKFFANRYRLKNRGPGVKFDEKFRDKKSSRLSH